MTYAYLIDAAAKTITKIEPDIYGYKRKHLTRGIALAAHFENGDFLYVDEEALLFPATVAFRIKRRADGQPMMSNGVLAGRDGIPGTDEPDTMSPVSTIEQLQAEIEWMTVEDALNWFRSKADEAAVTSTFGKTHQVHAKWADLLLNLTGGKGYHPATNESLQKAFRDNIKPK